MGDGGVHYGGKRGQQRMGGQQRADPEGPWVLGVKEVACQPEAYEESVKNFI